MSCYAPVAETLLVMGPEVCCLAMELSSIFQSQTWTQLLRGYLWLKVALAAAAAYLHTEAMTLPGVCHIL